jgi:glycogen debranching enzyme
MRRLIIVLALLAQALVAQQKHSVTIVTVSDKPTAEEQAAMQFLQSRSDYISQSIPLAKVKRIDTKTDVVWLHLTDSIQLNSVLKMKNELNVLRNLFEKGMNVLFTDYAAMLPYELGIEKNKPSVRVDTIHNDWLWDKRGFQGFRDHPVFEGMFGGEYVWDPNEDQLLPFVGYFDEQFPANGKVVAVDKAYVFVYSKTKLVIEHSSPGGKMISVGSSVYFSHHNNLRKNLERFICNTIDYLAGKRFSIKPTYWEHFKNKPKEFAIQTAPITPTSQRLMSELPESGLLLEHTSPTNQFFDVAGRRALFMGKENGGIDELWVHPYKVMYQYQTGIVFDDTVAWLDQFPVAVQVRPESFTRIYSTPKGTIKEIIFSSLWKAGGIVHYQTTQPVQLVIRCKSDFRWMWPYDMNALGDLYYGYDNQLNALHIKDISGDFYTLIGSDVVPQRMISGQLDSVWWKNGVFASKQSSSNIVVHAALYSLTQENNLTLNIAVIGTNEGKDAALNAYRAMLERPKSEYEEVVLHYRKLLASTLTINSPDKEFNALFKWAIIATDKFVAYTPGVGTGLLAGYSTTARGWNGAHKVSGRPGYAWYFGRDAAWSGFAIDDYGDFETVRQQLEFFEKFQDQSGKIFHEISTSGVVHYDASDATPLYVILAGHYLRASGDLEYLKKSWSKLKKAMEFLYSTDTDGDGLIENTNVGHGWVEGGALFGAHTEFYLASLWAKALKEMSLGAMLMEEYTLSGKYAADAERVQKILNTDFWNDSTKFYNLGKLKDGTYQTEKTVLPAVGAYFNLLEESKVRSMLDEYATNSFTADWGIRIVSSASKLYNPTGYHYGSIWPLFTGWTALAEYEYGNSTQGFMHIWNNMQIKNFWALGYVEEVMHGAVYRPTGVCPHQCWSETNILHPAITGMVGWKPNAIEKIVDFKPRFPMQWDTVEVSNLKVGSSVIRYTMKRSVQKTEYTFVLEHGSPVDIHFTPEIPMGMVITSTIVNGKPFFADSKTHRGVLATPIIFGLTGAMTITFMHSEGIGMYAIMPQPQPGDSSAGYRIVSTTLTGKVYTVVVEGKSGGENIFAMNYFDRTIDHVDGAEIVATNQKGIVGLQVHFASAVRPYVRQTITVHLK